jgi:hypothetical protein
MDYASHDPSVVRSIRQRVLLDAWLRARRRPKSIPAVIDFDPEASADELADMMGFDVEGENETARFVITHEGTRLTATYGNKNVPPEKRTNRYLHDAIGPDRYALVVACYRACVIRKRPTYSITLVRDADGKEVSYERLLLPFAQAGAVTQADAVTHIVGSYKTISIDGGFKVDNLMGVAAAAAPVRVLNAVIDRELARRPAGVRIADDIVEAD